CEDIFSAVEDKFASKYLPQFRNSSSAVGNQLHFEDTTTFRLFFLMQVWRTHICTEKFKISASTSEKLRTLILVPDETLLKEFPLSVTYLTTSGDQFEYTKNFVGFATDHTPNIIFMNDFTIQFYDEINSVRKCLPLYGINRPSTFRYFLNYHEKEFIVKVMSDKERKEILTQAVIEFKVTPLLDTLRQGFIDHWIKKFGTPPTLSLTQSYIDGVIDWHNLPQVQRLSEDRIRQYTNEFLKKHTAT
ncbi:MAG TPA: hypothetical protein VKG26_06810, partial [Bacteroidia bacterium]|nr:hypothetical protein [Bacteroidia bacterium]